MPCYENYKYSHDTSRVFSHYFPGPPFCAIYVIYISNQLSPIGDDIVGEGNSNDGYFPSNKDM